MKVLLLLSIAVPLWFWSMAKAIPVQCVDEDCLKKPVAEGSIQPEIKLHVKENIQKFPLQKNTEPSRARRSVLDTITGSFKNATQYIGKKLHIIKKRQKKEANKYLDIFSENRKNKLESDPVKNRKLCHHITKAVGIDVTEAPTCCGHKAHKATEFRRKRETASDSDEEVETEVAHTNPLCTRAQKNIKIIIRNFLLASEEDIKVNSTINDESSTIELALEDDIGAREV